MYIYKIFVQKVLVLYIGVLLLFAQTANAQVWSALGAGTNGSVHATIVYGSGLVVAGSFSNAGGQNMNRIALWNGTSWQSLGIGMNDDVNALAMYNGYLIAAGKFTAAGGVLANRIAVWNGTIWTTFGNGFDGPVNALTTYNTDLIAGGTFQNSGSTPVSRIAKWNGSTWSAVGTGFDNDVNALATLGSYLLAGGSFLNANSPVKRIAQWNGTLWFPLGLGIDDGAVFVLRSYGGQIAVGGTFTTLGGTSVNRIARWNGTSWSQLGSGFSGGVYSLYANGSLLYAGGIFDFADFLPASKIALYNGTSWSAVGGGVSGSGAVVNAINGYASNVVFAGIFNMAGTVSANNIATWGNPLGINFLGGEVPSHFSLMQNYPNPFNPATNIKFSVPDAAGNVSLVVYNLLGNEVKTLVNSSLNPGTYEVNFSPEGIASGTYFYKLTGQGFSETRKMIVLK
jgi:type IX secretion system substrate protein/cortical protein marker for cell polarity/beta-propeller uncharacterized protein DUF5122